MAKPEFRKGGTRGAHSSSLPGRFAGQGAVSGSPFSQAQILHLMKTEFGRARRYGFPVACILIQVDRLTSMVDVHGRQLRDVVRRELSKLITGKTRGADHLGLVSDDRYLLVLPHATEQDATSVGERIWETFGMLEVESGGNVLSLSLSMGIASTDNQKTMFFDTILSQAETALSWAIDGDGGQVVVYCEEQRRGDGPLQK
ncbi:MAG: diguanylate cyclase [Planctomycetota bacterium]